MANYQRAESEALRLLSEFGFTEPPVNPRLVAYALGVKVTFVRFSGEESKVSDFYDFDENEIIVNEEEFLPRQTFTIAHELGHKVLHDDWVKSESYRVLPRDPSQQSKDAHEREADAFAANLDISLAAGTVSSASIRFSGRVARRGRRGLCGGSG